MKRFFSVLLAVCIFITWGSIYECEALSVNGFEPLINKIHDLNGSKQIVLVTTKNDHDTKASVKIYERSNGGWIEPITSFSAVIGSKGFSLNKVEGDKHSPAGIFKIGEAFGTVQYVPGTKMPYRMVSGNDYWIDDAASEDYNQWIHYEEDPYTRWKSFERLKIPLYKYSIIIEYNMNPVVKGKGSAIFFHLWKSADSTTLGCTAVSEANLLKLMKWIDPKKNPVIVQGAEGMLNELIISAEGNIIYPVRLKMNGKDLTLDVHPRIRNGRTLVPARAVFEEAGADVSWNEKERTVRIIKDNIDIKIKIDSNIALVGERKEQLDEPAQIINGRTLVPVRFIAESMGAEVTWQSAERTVVIDSIW